MVNSCLLIDIIVFWGVILITFSTSTHNEKLGEGFTLKSFSHIIKLPNNYQEMLSITLN